MLESQGCSPSPAQQHPGAWLLSITALLLSSFPINKDLREGEGSGAPRSPCTAAGHGSGRGEQRGSPLQLPEGWGKRRAGAWGSDGGAWPKSCPPAGARRQLQPNKGPINPATAVRFSASVHPTEEISLRNFHLWFAKGFSPKNHDLIAVIIFIKLSRVFFWWLFKAYLKDTDSSGTAG